MAIPIMRVKALQGGSVENQSGFAKVVHLPFSSSSAPARLFDPITLSGGLVSRGDNTSTALYGFGMDQTSVPEIRQIIPMPNFLDASSRIRYGTYVAGNGNSFVASTTPTRATTAADVGAQCDLAPALAQVTPVVTNIGTAGSTTYAYKVTAKNLLGESTGAGSATSTTTGNATLSSTNYNRLTIPSTPGASSFVIYRGGNFVAEIPANPGANTVYNDIGVTANTAISAPTRNDSGWVVAPAVASTVVISIVSLLDPEGTLGGRVRFRIASGKSQYV